jgi:anti-sigma factor RsiW
MKRNQSNEHPEDAILLAYLDAELSRVATRTIQKHLQTCWKCRSALAELELLAQAASKLLSQQDESDIARMRDASAKFLRVKTSLETHLKERSKTRSFSFKRLRIDAAGQEWLPRLLLI